MGCRRQDQPSAPGSAQVLTLLGLRAATFPQAEDLTRGRRLYARPRSADFWPTRIKPDESHREGFPCQIHCGPGALGRAAARTCLIRASRPALGSSGVELQWSVGRAGVFGGACGSGVHSVTLQGGGATGAQTGANARRVPQTAHDASRALSQVNGSSADSLGPGQTGRSCLGVRGRGLGTNLPRRPHWGPG